MRLSNLLWIVILSIVLHARNTRPYPLMGGKRRDLDEASNFNSDYDYGYANNGQLNADDFVERSLRDADTFNPECETQPPQTSSLPANNGPRPVPAPTTLRPDSTTCEPAPTPPPAESTTVLACDRNFMIAEDQSNPYQQQQQQQAQMARSNSLADIDEGELRSKELRALVQHLYVAQARVQLEATEIQKAQAVASSAQATLEESANHVRSITASLHNAQQEVAASAIRAQIAQLQLAAHDQLLFAARQDVDALSSQMVGLQAAEGIVQPKLTVDLHALLDKLKQPLQEFDRPTPVPAIMTLSPQYAVQQLNEVNAGGKEVMPKANFDHYMHMDYN